MTQVKERRIDYTDQAKDKNQAKTALISFKEERPSNSSIKKDEKSKQFYN